ncbi:MAG: sulfurtransferase TusA family protein [Bacteroidales bacterium]|nr:sulfurtransferase TusA family protein [Bacteroidales bacterium]MBP5419783.1 sulfurtransferase TusA family protein [Bacteroidales bacterium]
MVYTLDITSEHCPMTLVRTKLKLSQIAKGDILEVLLSEGEALNSVPTAVKEQGFNVVSIEHVEGTTHKLTIEK